MSERIRRKSRVFSRITRTNDLSRGSNGLPRPAYPILSYGRPGLVWRTCPRIISRGAVITKSLADNPFHMIIKRPLIARRVSSLVNWFFLIPPRPFVPRALSAPSVPNRNVRKGNQFQTTGNCFPSGNNEIVHSLVRTPFKLPLFHKRNTKEADVYAV